MKWIKGVNKDIGWIIIWDMIKIYIIEYDSNKEWIWWIIMMNIH